MSIPLMMLVWLFALGFGYTSGSWRGLQKRDAWIVCTLLLLSLALTVGIAINPQLPNPTEWVEQALSPLKPLLEPVN
ncbi:hypothetical protein [Paenibacillus paeoniae]|uniref:Uncharacterized protein n=1 Tax=Paenibacillus paeoniae TaxID=2292705 RepID=A0A371PM51_9BACL|nr:hypothetical protein [Paenibacillus paeoniae]REK77065.1 hypothetical protein DX130_08680 [Paenibacillus paeoniae]